MTFAIVSSSRKRLNILLKKHNDEIEGNEAQFWLNIYVGVTIDNRQQSSVLENIFHQISAICDDYFKSLRPNFGETKWIDFRVR